MYDTSHELYDQSHNRTFGAVDTQGLANQLIEGFPDNPEPY